MIKTHWKHYDLENLFLIFYIVFFFLTFTIELELIRPIGLS